MSQESSTALQLASVVKSARRTMRKDKGLSTDLDRLPQLTWLMFLKFLDDLELLEESRARVRGTPHAEILPAPYRWRDWGATTDLGGDELIEFITSKETKVPDGHLRPGLLEFLKSIEPGEGAAQARRAVIRSMFQDVENRMRSGYLLRDVVDCVNRIHFTSKDELYTLGHIYESMLKEMRDAAGENGEFYTPRPVVRFIVEAVSPRMGETVLDPACGTGGFLADAFTHLRAQCETVEDIHRLQNETLFGGEAKPLPFLLCEMNLLLHGVEAPNIDPGNSLRHRLADLGTRDEVDVILTNPPFGGAEERSILSNFPSGLRTEETALLFLQLIMRRLRKPTVSAKAGRGAVIVPNGVLSGEGIAARVRQLLVEQFHLTSVVRLPIGVFEPYTTIPTNILFFDASGPTDGVWYYEVPGPDDRKFYTKKRQLTSEDLQDLRAWWQDKTPTEHGWLVSRQEIESAGFGLDFKNPSSASWKNLTPPSSLGSEIQTKTQSLATIAGEVARLAGAKERAGGRHDAVPLHELLRPECRAVRVQQESAYELLGVRLDGQGPYHRETKTGAELSSSTLYQVRSGDFIYSRLYAWRGAFGMIPPEYDGFFVSNEFPTYVVAEDRLDIRYLLAWFRLPLVLAKVESDCQGSTPVTRNRYKEKYFLELQFPLPSLSRQKSLVGLLAEVGRLEVALEELQGQASILRKSAIGAAFPEGDV